MRRVRPLSHTCRRWKSERAAQAALSLLALGGFGCAAFEDDQAESDHKRTARSGVLTVAEQPAETSAAWTDATRLHVGGRTITLSRPVNATLIATLAPVAVADARQRLVAYNSWRGRRPTIRLRAVGGGSDVELDSGAHSPAWRRDGALAHFKAARAELRDPRRYVGHVVVRASPRAPARAWTSGPGRYVVAAWAGERLLVYRLAGSFPDLLVLDGPKRQRVLMRGSALVALSPDGRRAFLSRYGASRPLVRVVDVGSGAVVATLRVTAERVRFVVESGSWVGDRVFAATTSGVAVFRVGATSVSLEQVLRADETFAGGLSEARALDGGRRFVAWGELQPLPRQAVPQAALVDCDRISRRCVRVAAGSSVAPPRPVYNPSRP